MLELVDIHINERCKKVLSCIDIKDSRIEYNNDLNIDSIMCLMMLIKSNPSNTYLLGNNTLEQVQVNQWITFSFDIQNIESMTILDNFLYVKSFLVGNRLSLADYFVYLSISDYLQQNTSNISFLSINRWYSHIQSLIQNTDINKVTLPTISKPTIYSTPIEFPNFEVINTISNSITNPVESSNQKEVPAIILPSQDKQPVAATTEKDIDTNQSLDPTKLDIRCGLVIKCWNHPDSDKLLCEEVDLGVADGGGIRTIASGIRQYYTAEQLQGRKVLVLANLKERSMAGFKSQVSILILNKFCSPFMYFN